MSLHINRMVIRLPAGFEHRGAEIARKAVQHLSRSDLGNVLPADRIRVTVGADPAGADTAIARDISDQIGQTLRRQRP